MFFHVLKFNNIGFPVKEKLIKPISVGECMRFNIQCYVPVSLIYILYFRRFGGGIPLFSCLFTFFVTCTVRHSFNQTFITFAKGPLYIFSLLTLSWGIPIGVLCRESNPARGRWLSVPQADALQFNLCRSFHIYCLLPSNCISIPETLITIIAID